MIMLAALWMHLAFQPIIRPTPPAPVSLCAYIDRWRGSNVPISPATPRTDIAHAIALAIDGRSPGWIVIRRDGKAWYFDGPVSGPRPKADDTRAALHLLGLDAYTSRDAGVGQMIPITKTPDIVEAARQGFSFYTCY